MKKIVLVVYSLCILVFLQGCKEKSELGKLSVIAGTPVRLVVPAVYRAAPEIVGLKHQSLTSSIIVIEVPRAFKEALQDLTRDQLREQGLELIAQEEVSVSGREGLLSLVSQVSQGIDFRQWILAIPHEESTLTVNGNFLNKDTEVLSDLIREALLSTKIDDSVTSEQALSFYVAPPFELAKVMPGQSLVYTKDGKWEQQSLQELSFLAGTAPLPGNAELSQMALVQFKEICPPCSPDSLHSNEIIIDNLRAIEMWGFTPDLGKLKYEVIAFDTARYYLMIGTAAYEQKHYLELFQSTSKSFRRKRGKAEPLL